MPPERLADRPLAVPHPDRLRSDHPHLDETLRRHASAMERGDACYVDPPTGLFVLTAKFLADRGTCCDKGCRHCPYIQ